MVSGNSAIPSQFQLQYPEDRIASAVERLGGEISSWAEIVWQRSHTDILALPVLRGGIFFFADLVRCIRTSVEMAPVQSRAYVPGKNEVQLDDVSVNVAGVPVAGRCVLLVDDICDSGRTLRALSDALTVAGAAEVKSAVLIQRALKEPMFNPDYSGFLYEGPEWFVGYGMEDSNRWSNLPDIYTIRRSS